MGCGSSKQANLNNKCNDCLNNLKNPNYVGNQNQDNSNIHQEELQEIKNYF